MRRSWHFLNRFNRTCESDLMYWIKHEKQMSIEIWRITQSQQHNFISVFSEFLEYLLSRNSMNNDILKMKRIDVFFFGYDVNVQTKNFKFNLLCQRKRKSNWDVSEMNDVELKFVSSNGVCELWTIQVYVK